MVSICPTTLLSDDLEDYKKSIDILERFPNLNLIEFDMMDGSFVPIEAPPLNKILSLKCEIPRRIHLMYEKPLTAIQTCQKNNVEEIVFHFESDLKDYSKIETSNSKILLGINPDTKVEEFEDKLDKVDGVMIMTVVPGAQGTPHLPGNLDKITKLRELGFNKKITIDGGVNQNTLENVLAYNLDEVTIGSAIIKQENPILAYERLSKMLK